MTSIFHHPIADNYKVRWVFQDMLMLANSDGIIDMMPEHIARDCNCPLELVREAIEELEKPDPGEGDGRFRRQRLERIYPHLNWGWKILDYEFFLSICHGWE